MASYTLICLAFLTIFSFAAFESALAGRPEPTSSRIDMKGASTRSMDQVVNPIGGYLYSGQGYPYSSGQGYGYPYTGQGYPYNGQPYFPNYNIPPFFPTIGGPLSYPYGSNFPYSNGPGSFPYGSGSYPYGSGSYPYGSGSSIYGPPSNGDAKARP